MKNVLKKMAAMGLVATVGFSLAGCGAKASANEGTKNETTTETGTTQGGEKIKATLCVARKNDQSFQQSANDGFERVKAELGEYYDLKVVEMTDDVTLWKDAMYEASESDAEIIVGVGFMTKENFQTIPAEFPDKKYILLDENVDYSAGDLSNVLSVGFEANQSGFLAGAAAAQYTTSEKANADKTIGFVGAMENVIINDFLLGYVEGAKYVDPEIKVVTSYVGNFLDSAKAKELGLVQYNQENADIIFSVTGGAGPGVIEAAHATNNLVIGVDGDQSLVYEGRPEQSTIVTSGLKRLDNVIFNTFKAYAEDKNSVPFGEHIILGLEEEAVGIVYNDILSANLSEEAVTSLKDIESKIKAGEIKVSRARELTTEELKAIVTK